MTNERITLSNLAGGAVEEKFQTAWEKVLENINDPNKKLNFAREVNIKIKVKPKEGSDANAVSIDVREKLAPEYEHETQVFVGTDTDGNIRALEFNPQQPELPFDSAKDIQDYHDENEKVINIGGKK